MLFVSRGCRALTGFEPRDFVELRSVSYAGLIHPEDRRQVQDTLRRALTRGEKYELAYRIRDAGGGERWVWERGTVVPSAEASGEAVVEGFVMDASERTELEQQLSTQASRFRALVEQSLVGVYLIQGSGFAYVNPRMAEIFGYSVPELLAVKSLFMLVHPEDRKKVEESIELRRSGIVESLRYEFRILRRDGEERDVQAHGRRIEIGGEVGIMGAALDVTDRRRAQRRYHEGQKMEALGRLATGVAHDMNNVLAVIRTTAELLMLERAGDTGLVSNLRDIVATVNRGTEMGRQLIEFGRPRSTVAERIRLGHLMEELSPTLERMVGKEITLEVVAEPDAPHVELRPAQAQELVVNLALNAKDAMPDGGALTVRVHGRPVAAREPPSEVVEQVVLEVTDTGVGIPAEHRARIFEPYFTTKGARGTGLGLANVWRIAKDAGGTVEVDSEVGRGSCFRVLFPAVGERERPPVRGG